MAGKLAVTLPSAPVTVPSVTVPLVAFPSARVPTVPDAPSVGVAVKAGDAPANTCPAAPVMDTAPAALTAIGAVPVIAPPPDEVTQVAQVSVPVVALKASGDVAASATVPVVLGSVSTIFVPATACG